MEVITIGGPSYDSLTDCEKRLLLKPLVATIRKFYENPENRRKYEEWLANKKATDVSTSGKQENIDGANKTLI